MKHLKKLSSAALMGLSGIATGGMAQPGGATLAQLFFQIRLTQMTAIKNGSR